MGATVSVSPSHNGSIAVKENSVSKIILRTYVRDRQYAEIEGRDLRFDEERTVSLAELIPVQTALEERCVSVRLLDGSHVFLEMEPRTLFPGNYVSKLHHLTVVDEEP